MCFTFSYIKNADAKENKYTILRIFWWETPSRDENWREEKIKINW